jgi:catechol 2,3-dioxygenase-like lactoylglutathione lyase family enzyme
MNAPMNRSIRRTIGLTGSAAAALFVWTIAAAQTTAFPGGVVGVGNLSHIVASLDRSVQFYRDVIGLEVDGAPRVFTGDLAMKVGNTRGAQSLFTTLKVPGSPLGVEIIEYRDIERLAAHPRVQDPGAVIVTLTVRDIDAIVARATAAGVHINTVGGAPVTVPGGTRVIVLRDPDGFFVGLVQPTTIPETTAPASSNVIGSTVEVMVVDTDRTARLYTEALGFDIRAAATWDGSQLMMDLAGTPGAQVRRIIARIPGMFMTISFAEFKDIDRTPLRTRFQDPGTPVLQLRVRDVQAVTNRWKKAGGDVITAGGQPVNLGTQTLVVLRDPNGLMLEMISAP